MLRDGLESGSGCSAEVGGSVGEDEKTVRLRDRAHEGRSNYRGQRETQHRITLGGDPVKPGGGGDRRVTGGTSRSGYAPSAQGRFESKLVRFMR